MEPTYRLTRQQLYDLVWSRPLSALAAEFQISGNGLAKICDRLMVPHPPRGYWSGSAPRHGAARPALPPRPDDCAADVVISAERAPSRRNRTRLPLAARRDQIADAAAELVAREGVHAVTMKRVAGQVGISEALAYNYFANQTELLTHIARREQTDMNASQQAEIEKETRYSRRARASVEGYLNYIERRGSLLQTLLGSGDVRAGLRQEHQSRRAWVNQSMAAGLAASAGIPLELAMPGTQMTRAVGLRAGNLLARGRTSRATVERLAVTIMEGARTRLPLMASPDDRSEPPEDI